VRRALLPVAVATGLAALLLAACGSPGPSPLARNPELDPGTQLHERLAPGITLPDQFGQQTSLQQFRGKVVILAFVDSECTTICPLTTAEMLEAKSLLGKAGSQVQLLGVDANPDATTEQDVKAYSLAHGMLDQWHFMTGPLAQLESVWKEYGIAVEIQNGAIDHTPALFEIDPQGRLRTVYLSQMSYASIDQQAQVLAQKASQLLPHHPRLLSLRSYDRIAPITPASRVVLPSTGGSGTVQLGPGQSRVIVFFATWLSETSDVSGQLEDLRAYETQALASNGSLPSLVAVDEGSVEPGGHALGALLGSLSEPLNYPVAVDQTGRVADGYGVQDQPWFVITTKTGKTVWSNDGWVPASVLLEHAQSLAR
jgi:cytochrome oxidase Cu insertion factor (SCO1/SenC/PrrC family)